MAPHFRLLARNRSHLPFSNPPFGPFDFSPAASCAPRCRYYHPVLRQSYNCDGRLGHCVWYISQEAVTACSRSMALGGESHLRFERYLSPLPSVTTSSASCHRRFLLLLSMGKNRTNPAQINTVLPPRHEFRCVLNNSKPGHHRHSSP